MMTSSVIPASHPILAILIDPLIEWLVSYGFAPQDAKETAKALPIYFVHALNEEWARRPEDYKTLRNCFQERITTPFTVESLWLRYSAWLKKRVDEPILGESFGLSRIYIPLRGYYESPQGKEKNPFSIKTQGEPVERVGLWVEDTLYQWLSAEDKNDALRVISAEPGRGKSSFLKMWAAKLSQPDRLSMFNPSC